MDGPDGWRRTHEHRARCPSGLFLFAPSQLASTRIAYEYFENWLGVDFGIDFVPIGSCGRAASKSIATEQSKILIQTIPDEKRTGNWRNLSIQHRQGHHL